MADPLDEFFDRCWRDHVALAPQAQRIAEALRARGLPIVNDHVAFRTFRHPGLAIADLEPALTGLGLAPHEDHEFPDSHLRARSYLPPRDDQPRVFLSELLLGDCAPIVSETVAPYLAAVRVPDPPDPSLFTAGRCWAPPDLEDYSAVGESSPYAAWLLVHGLRPNHCTISMNHLGIDWDELIAAVEGLGYSFNDEGGIVKGSADDGLEQAATWADVAEADFAGGVREMVPTCYQEFALRHPGTDGEPFQGFLAGNARHIFRSTDRGQAGGAE